MTRTRIFWTTFLTLGVWLLVVPPANAYVEWLSGTAAWQALIAGVMAAGLSIKMFWRRIKMFFVRSGRESGAEAATDIEATGDASQPERSSSKVR